MAQDLKNHGKKCKTYDNAIILDDIVDHRDVNGFWRKQNG